MRTNQEKEGAAKGVPQEAPSAEGEGGTGGTQAKGGTGGTQC